MRVFKMYVGLDNAAFEDGAECAELARILRTIADKLEDGEQAPWAYQTIHDGNGNDVGRYAAKDGDNLAALFK